MKWMTQWMTQWKSHSLLAGLGLLGVLVLEGCTAPSSRAGGFESDNPATLLYAITDAGEQRDSTKIPRLVETLENDDPAVRMMAINALERITGQRLGYKPYGSSVDRAPAVTRWQARVNNDIQRLSDAQTINQTPTTNDVVNPQ